METETEEEHLVKQHFLMFDIIMTLLNVLLFFPFHNNILERSEPVSPSSLPVPTFPLAALLVQLDPLLLHGQLLPQVQDLLLRLLHVVHLQGITIMCSS